MFKLTCPGKSATAIGLFCLLGSACGTRSVQTGPPLAARPKAGSEVAANPYGEVKPARISEYLKTMYRSAQANRIKAIGEEPRAELSPEARSIAARTVLHPDDPELAKELARVLIREGRLVEAFEALDRVRSVPATDAEIEAGLALVWQKLGSTHSALYHAQQAWLLEPSPANLARLGKIHLQREDFEAALEALEEAQLSFPESQSIALDLARAAAGTGDWVTARDYYRRALELDPEWGLARSGLAGALARLGDVPAALAEFRRLFGVAEAYARLADQLMAAERWEMAQDAFKEALRYDAGNRDLALKLATVDSYLPFPSTVALITGQGAPIDVQSLPAEAGVSLPGRAGNIQLAAASTEPLPPGKTGLAPVVEVASDAERQLDEPAGGQVARQSPSAESLSVGVVELVGLPVSSQDPAVTLAGGGAVTAAALQATGGGATGGATVGSAGAQPEFVRSLFRAWGISEGEASDLFAEPVTRALADPGATSLGGERPATLPEAPTPRAETRPYRVPQRICPLPLRRRHTIDLSSLNRSSVPPVSPSSRSR